MTYKFTVSGLDCPNCAKKLTAIIEKKNGIESVKLNFLTEDLTVVSDLDADAVVETIKASAAEFSKKVSVTAK